MEYMSQPIEMIIIRRMKHVTINIMRNLHPVLHENYAFKKLYFDSHYTEYRSKKSEMDITL